MLNTHDKPTSGIEFSKADCHNGNVTIKEFASILGFINGSFLFDLPADEGITQASIRSVNIVQK
jgi:hypothetical protein